MKKTKNDSSLGNSPYNPKKFYNVENSEISATDEEISRFSENNQEKRKLTPQNSAEKSPNEFQSPRGKSKINENDEFDSSYRISENSANTPETIMIRTSLELTNQPNILIGINMENNVQTMIAPNDDSQPQILAESPEQTTDMANSSASKKIHIQTNIMMGGILLNNNQSFQ